MKYGRFVLPKKKLLSCVCDAGQQFLACSNLFHGENGINACFNCNLLCGDACFGGSSSVGSSHQLHVAIGALHAAAVGADVGAQQLAERTSTGIGNNGSLLACVFDSLSKQLVAVKLSVADAEGNIIDCINAGSTDFINYRTKLADILELDAHTVAGGITGDFTLDIGIWIKSIACCCNIITCWFLYLLFF